jgi:dihydropteroate synthase
MAAAPAAWSLGEVRLSLSRPRIMGVVNVTPDSFSDGGRYLDPAAARARVRELAAQGADILDIGGESTRPGADPVPAPVEIDRILPAVREAAGSGVPVSVDTSKAEVAAAALAAGAVIVNDVTGLGDPDMGSLVARHGAGLVLMHMQGTPRTMQADPRYDDVVGEVCAQLAARRAAAEAAGIPRERIALDPGIGFGKTAEHNLELLTHLPQLAALGSPILVGVSRKRFIGTLSGEADPGARLPGTLAAVLAARLGGAGIFRVHDVAAVRQALAVFDALVPGRAPHVPAPAR